MSAVFWIVYGFVSVYVARRVTRSVYLHLYKPDTADWMMSSLVGLLAGLFWPILGIARLVIGKRPS